MSLNEAEIPLQDENNLTLTKLIQEEEKKENEISEFDLKNEKKKKTTPVLIETETHSSNVHIFSIRKKEIKSYEVSFSFLYFMDYCHLENSLFLAGGWTDDIS